MDPRIVYFYTNIKKISICYIRINTSVRVIKIEDFIIQKNNRLYGPYGNPIIMISGFELYPVLFSFSCCKMLIKKSCK